MPTINLSSDIGLLINGARSVLETFRIRMPNGTWKRFCHEDLRDTYVTEDEDVIVYSSEEVNWKPKKGNVATIELMGGSEMFYFTKHESCEISMNVILTDQLFGLFKLLPCRVKDIVLSVYDSADNLIGKIKQRPGTPAIVAITTDLALSDNKLNKELYFYIESYIYENGDLPELEEEGGIII